MSTYTDTTQIFFADVIRTNTIDRSTVVGNYYSLPEISTYHQRTTEMWVRLGDGREVRIDIGGDFPVLPGHRIAFLTSPSQIWAARNFNTNTIHWLVSADTLTGSFSFCFHWVLLAGAMPAFFIGFLISEFIHPHRPGKLGYSHNDIAQPIPYIAVCVLVLIAVTVGVEIRRHSKHAKRVRAIQAAITEGHAKLLAAQAYPAVPPPVPMGR